MRSLAPAHSSKSAESARMLGPREIQTTTPGPPYLAITLQRRFFLQTNFSFIFGIKAIVLCPIPAMKTPQRDECPRAYGLMFGRNMTLQESSGNLYPWLSVGSLQNQRRTDQRRRDGTGNGAQHDALLGDMIRFSYRQKVR